MLRKIWKYAKITIKENPGFFILSVGFVLLSKFFVWGMSVSSAYALDVTTTATQVSQIIIPFLVFFLFITLGGNTGNFNNFLTTIYTQKAWKVFNKMFMKRSYVEKQDSFYNSEFYNNYEFVKANIAHTTQINVAIFNHLLGAVVGFIMSVVTISFFSPLILIYIFIISVTMVLVNKYITKKRVQLNQEYVKDERSANYYGNMLCDRPHSKELRVFGLKNFFFGRWFESFKKFTRAKYKFEKKSLWLSQIPVVLEHIISSVLILAFLYSVYIETLTFGSFVLIYQMMWQITWSLTGIIEILTNNIFTNYQYIDKFDELMESDKVEKNTPKTTSVKKGFEKLTLENISYSYPNQSGKALNGVNIEVKKGEIVCILGYNGSGKSTLSKIMCGLLEDYQGTVTLDGVNIKDIEPEQLYPKFGIGFQDFTRYSLSLYDNVAVGMIEQIDNTYEVEKAIKKSKIDEIINELPNLQNTILGKEYDPNGQDLSGGQWQRIILSRAYMGNPDILILDEPTASVDPLEEMRMLENFGEIIEGKTAILISHRIGFARLSNRIYMMEDGEIVEQGSHNELLIQKGKYYELFTSQKELYTQGGM